MRGLLTAVQELLGQLGQASATVPCFCAFYRDVHAYDSALLMLTQVLFKTDFEEKEFYGRKYPVRNCHMNIHTF